MRRRHLTERSAGRPGCAALPALGRRAQARRDARRRARRCCAMRSRSPRPASTRPRSATSIRASITAHIFDAPLTYDYLARPFKLRPLTARRCPRSRRLPDLHVPASGPASTSPTTRRSRAGAASWSPQDYVYSIKRHFDPQLKSPQLSTLENEGIVGLRELRRRGARRARSRSTTTARSRACARSTATRLRVQLREPRPRLLYTWAARDVIGAVAREVVEVYGDSIMAHPVGTGPFRLADWRRSSRIVLERNPTYREQLYDGEPHADDAEARRAGGGSRAASLPMIDRVEIAIIEQPQPRWLAFLNGEHDLLERLPNEFVDQAMPDGKAGAQPGQARHRHGALPLRPTSRCRLQHGEPGGRRLHAGQGGAAPRHRARQSTSSARSASSGAARRSRRSRIVPPMTEGYDADLRSRDGRVRPGARQGAARPVRLRRPRRRRLARAARRPARCVLEMATQPDQTQPPARRAVEEGHGRARPARSSSRSRKWPENLKAARAGKLHDVARRLERRRARRRRTRSSAATARASGKGNLARFELPAFDALYEQLKRRCPTGPSAQALFDEAHALIVAYMPYKVPRAPHRHRHGYAVAGRLPPPPFWQRLVAVRRHRPRRRAQARRRHEASPVRLALAAALLGGALPRRAGRRRGAEPTARRCCATPSAIAETGFDPAQIRDLYSRIVTAHIFEAPYRYDHLARPVKVEPQHGGGDAARCRPTSSTWTIRIRPGIYFADDPAFKGKQRELVAAGLRLLLQALLRPGQQEPARTLDFEPEGILGLERAARRRRSTAKRPFDYDRAGRRPARARPLHAAVQARSEPRPRFIYTLADIRPARRRRARGGRGLRRSHRRAPGRHRAVPARRVAAQLADRARAQPRLPRDALRRRARRRRRRGPGAAARASRAGACR